MPNESQVVHGLSVPLGKLGYHLPRTLSSRIESRSNSRDLEEPDDPFHIQDRVRSKATVRNDRGRQENRQRAPEEPARPVFRIGGSIIQSGISTPSSPAVVATTQDSMTDQMELSEYVQRSESRTTDEQPGSIVGIADTDIEGRDTMISPV